jgi:hypothetical protein
VNHLGSIFLVLILSLFSLDSNAESGCKGESTYCFDGCSGSNTLQIDADSCNVAYDPQRGCNYGYGYCSKPDVNPTPSSRCKGQITYCFDGCSGSNTLQIDADSCNVAYDPQRGCNYGYGYCSKD